MPPTSQLLRPPSQPRSNVKAAAAPLPHQRQSSHLITTSAGSPPRWKQPCLVTAAAGPLAAPALPGTAAPSCRLPHSCSSSATTTTTAAKTCHIRSMPSKWRPPLDVVGPAASHTGKPAATGPLQRYVHRRFSPTLRRSKRPPTATAAPPRRAPAAPAPRASAPRTPAASPAAPPAPWPAPAPHSPPAPPASGPPPGGAPAG